MNRAEEIKAILQGLKNSSFAVNKEEMTLLEEHRKLKEKAILEYRGIFKQVTPIVPLDNSEICPICYCDPIEYGLR